MKGDKEYIVCSAIWYQAGKKFSNAPKNVDEGTVLFGLRHNIFELLITLYPNYKQDQCTIQGFLTSDNRFVDRVEGLKIAIEAGQVSEKLSKNKRLYSEDLY
jgi:hypothetical protein